MSRGTRIDDETLQNFINEHTVDLENIKRIQKKRKRENLQDVKFAPTRCQNPSMSKSDNL
jgi:hypothetical protein